MDIPTSEESFTAAVEQHRRELHVHCYRMTGSYSDAQDLVQETFLRAWRSRDRFEGRSSFRAWLYRIATNACLDTLQHSSRRTVAAGAPADLLAESPHFTPYPDALLDEMATGPDEDVVARETIELAFLAAIQHLVPRQRAVLIVRDVLGWTAAETAEVLGLSVTTTNSLLQRARATLQRHGPPRRTDWSRRRVTDREAELLQRYMDAHERADAAAVIALLGDDARITMPPDPPYIGTARSAEFLTEILAPDGPGQWRLVPTAANRQPATANYLRRPGDTTFRALSIDVLRIEEGRLVEVNCFFGDGLFGEFGLPLARARRRRSTLRPAQVLRARARRFPSCIACTRGTGMPRPSSMRSSLKRCGLAMPAAHGSRFPRSFGAVCTVKSAGVTSSRSDQSTGKDTGQPGRTRGLYAATTVAPPTRVASTNTLAPRSSFMKAVVAISGSSRSTRAAIARSAPAASSGAAWSSIGTNTCRPFAPLVLTEPGEPGIGEHRAHEMRDLHRHRERFSFRRVEVHHEMGHALGVVHLRERGVELDGPLVPEPDQRAAVVAQRVRDVALRRLGPDAHRAHPRRRVLRHVLLHERLLTAVDPDHRERTILEHRDDPVADAVEIVDEIPLGRARPVEQRLIEVRQRHALARLLALSAHRGLTLAA